MANNDESGLGLFLQTTQIWNTATANIPDELKPLFSELYRNINKISIALNLKETGYYPLREIITGKLLFPNPNLSPDNHTNLEYRQIYRKVINFGALPNATTKAVPHEITVNNELKFTNICAVGNDTTNHVYYPLSFGSDITIKIDGDDIKITTTSNQSSVDTCFVILEYIKD